MNRERKTKTRTEKKENWHKGISHNARCPQDGTR